MQAGEMINFIRPVDVMQRRGTESAPENQERAQKLFVGICHALFEAYPEATEWRTVRHADDAVLVEESMLYVAATHDGSFLHVVPHVSINDEGESRYGLAVLEYANGVEQSNNGYLYTLTEEGLVRTPLVHGNGKNDSTRFSIALWHELMDELHDLRESNDPEQREAAEEMYGLYGARSYTETWKDLPRVYPDEEEIAALDGILVMARPYSS